MTALRTRSADDRLALLLEVTAAANEAGSFAAAAAASLAALCDHAGFGAGHALVRNEAATFVSLGIWEFRDGTRFRGLADRSAGAALAADRDVPGRILAGDRAVWIPDAQADAGIQRFTGDHDVRGVFAFPVWTGGVLTAVLEFFSAAPLEPQPELEPLCRQIAAQLGHVLTRERAEARIRFQARLLEAVGQAVIGSDARHRIVYWNRAAEMLFGWSREEALGRIDSELIRTRADAAQTAEITARLAAGQPWEGEFTVRRRDGASIPIHLTGAALHDPDGAPAGYVGIATDLRRTRQIEAQLRRAQSMEAVGRLAGGIAHDFNNLLTSITGVAHLLIDDLPRDSPILADLLEIRTAAERAAALTSKLLAFSRQQVLKPRVVDLNDAVRALEPAMRRAAPRGTTLSLELDPSIGQILVDPAQLEHVVLNLVQNAAEHVAAGGRIAVRTGETVIDGAAARLFTYEVRQGRYVTLEVEDDGTGIAVADQDRVFEPFFTTKRTGTGSGAGLGLSTVYGIVKQSDGYIWVDSVPGRGATFRVLLPWVERAPEAVPVADAAPAVEGRSTLLLVEDEDAVRKLARKILIRHGYEVLEATNGVEAVELCRTYDGRIDLIVTDVVMPNMGGAELVRRVRTLRPRTPVLLMSGYPGDAVRQGVAGTGGRFLEKPFTPDALAHAVRAALDEGAENGG